MARWGFLVARCSIAKEIQDGECEKRARGFCLKSSYDAIGANLDLGKSHESSKLQSSSCVEFQRRNKNGRKMEKPRDGSHLS